MPAPDSWGTPTSNGDIAESTRWGWISYLDGTWVVLNIDDASNGALPYIRWTQDPEGDWNLYQLSTSELNGLQVQESAQQDAYRVQKYGDDYYFVGMLYDYAALDIERRYSSYLIHATDPGGPWEATGITGSIGTGTTPRHVYDDFRYINGEFVGVGATFTYGSITTEARIATSSSLLDTQTADFTGPSSSAVRSIDFDGTYYVRAYTNNPGGTADSVIQYSTALDTGWTNTDPIFTPNPWGTNERSIVRYVNGWWVVGGSYFTGVSRPVLYYADDPTGTWGTVNATDLGMAVDYNDIWDIEYGGGYWVIVGGRNGSTTTKRISYLAAGPGDSPAGTYTQVTPGLSSTDYVIPSVAYGDGIFVFVSNDGQIKYSRVQPPAPRGPRLLRQRQSPLRTPSRVRGVDLRQRQTPYIR